MGQMSAIKSQAALKSKEWRERKQAEDPAFLEREREKARNRARARLAEKKDDPVFQAKERERQRLHMAEKRKSPEFIAKEKLARAKYMENPENRESAYKATQEWRKANSEHVAAYQAEWRSENAEAVSAYNKAYMAEYVLKEDVQFQIWKRGLWKNYRMSDKDFNDLWDKQGGSCAICNVKVTPRGRGKDAVAVDHNHATGEVRGLLCRACNHGIGCLKDRPDVLLSAAKYLQERGYYGGDSIGVVNHE